MESEPIVRSGGLAVLDAVEGIDLEGFRAALADRLPALRAGIGRDVTVRLGVRYPVDPLAAIYGERAMQQADAILDLEAADGVTPEALAGRMGALRDLARSVDLARSAIGIGRITFIQRHRPEGGEILSFLGRKAPGASFEDMSQWWYRHAALAQRLQEGMACRWSYGQLRVDGPASARAAEAAGMPAVPYDMGDIIAIADRAQFLGWTTDPVIARRMEEDEKGFLDQASWRGGIVEAI